MVKLHLWIAERRKSQSLPAIFADAYLIVHERPCTSNKTALDATRYETRLEIPDYLYSYFEREKRCTRH